MSNSLLQQNVMIALIKEGVKPEDWEWEQVLKELREDEKMIKPTFAILAVQNVLKRIRNGSQATPSSTSVPTPSEEIGPDRADTNQQAQVPTTSKRLSFPLIKLPSLRRIPLLWKFVIGIGVLATVLVVVTVLTYHPTAKATAVIPITTDQKLVNLGIWNALVKSFSNAGWPDIRETQVQGSGGLSFAQFYANIPHAFRLKLSSFLKVCESGDLDEAKKAALKLEEEFPELKEASITPSAFVPNIVTNKQTTPGPKKDVPAVVPTVAPSGPTQPKQPTAGSKSQPTSPQANKATAVPTKVPTATEEPTEEPTATEVPTEVPATPTPKPAPTLKVKALPAPKVAVYYVYPHKGSTTTGVDTGLDRGSAFMTVVFWTRNVWGVEAGIDTYGWINRQLDSLGPGGGNLASIYDQIASKLPTPVPASAPYVFGAQGLTREQAFAMTVGWWRELRKEEPDVQVKDWLNKRLDELGVGGDISAIYQKILAMSKS